jgi:hypothetical protein
VVAVLAPALVTACGGSGTESATQLLQQTFAGHHSVSSGALTFSLRVTPSGSTELTQPITFTFGGPFQSLGKSRLPESNFTVTISAQGATGSLGILSTGTTGYVTLDGTSYQLPDATFHQLESSFSQIGGGSSSTNLSGLGIHPLKWLANPSIVGTESVGGATTTHIHSGLNVPALLQDISEFLRRAATLSSAAKVPDGISPAAMARISGEVTDATVDVWTGSSDKTIRKLAVNLNLPVTGKLSTELGGLRTAGVGLSMQYANLNQPQTIVAPTNVQPYSEFAAKARAFVQALESQLAGGATGSTGTSGSGATASGGTSGSGAAASGGAPSSTSAQRYEQCIEAAKGNIDRLQRCAPLLNGR